MDKEQCIEMLIANLSEIKKDIAHLEQEMPGPGWKKVRSCLHSASCFMNRAEKEIANLKPMEGQLTLFDMEGII